MSMRKSCPCCGAPGTDLDRFAVGLFLTGRISAAANIPAAELLCRMHLAKLREAMAHVAYMRTLDTGAIS